jgi:hypothetical protein
MDKVVAIVDVLGFKGRLNRDGLPALVKSYEALRQVVSRQRRSTMLNCAVPTGGQGRAAAFGLFDVGQDYFSDTILFWCSYSSFHFFPFCGVLLDFFCDVLELGIPLRGGIAVGETHIDEATRSYIGDPINEAAAVEQAQNWIGISFGPSFAIHPYNNLFEAEQVLVYRRHRKTDRADLIPGAVLDWPRRWRETRQKPAIAILQQMNTDQKFTSYYEITESFVRFSEDNKDWYKNQGSIHIGNP